MPQQRPTTQQPDITATPEQRAKFWTLVFLAGIVILLIWILALPFQQKKAKEDALQGASFFSVIRKPFSSFAESVPVFIDSFSKQAQ